MKDEKDYNWIDDPFNDKKQADAAARMGSGSKILIGCGLLIAIVAVIVIAIVFMVTLLGVEG